MAVKNFESIDSINDITNTTTMLHEAIPLTGTIVSGTYGVYRSERNIKDYTHGQFQSVYDYPFLSSSANHIFDITLGYDESSGYSGSASVQNSKKINMYNQFAQVLLGYTSSNSDGIRKFENDLTLNGDNYMKEVFFVSFSRLLTKDQIKKGTFSLTLGTGSWAAPFLDTKQVTLSDLSASVGGEGTLNTDGGDYGVLFSGSGGDAAVGCGLIFYQAGIAVITASVFDNTTVDFEWMGTGETANNPKRAVSSSFTGSTVSGACNAFRHRLKNLSFNNTTEINSKIYFCRVPHNKFNYSANPTYVSSSKIVVKNQSTDNPVSYITTVGLYNASNDLVAVAKLSEPLKKDPTNDITLRVRLDY
tara:strand:+ start:4640 stop:5722 length:1083 start_codon:yes stop_codon:yes gene_type:complete